MGLRSLGDRVLECSGGGVSFGDLEKRVFSTVLLCASFLFLEFRVQGTPKKVKGHLLGYCD